MAQDNASLDLKSLDDRSGRTRVGDYQLLKLLLRAFKPYRALLIISLVMLLVGQAAMASGPVVIKEAIGTLRVAIEGGSAEARAAAEPAAADTNRESERTPFETLTLWLVLLGIVYLAYYGIVFTQVLLVNKVGQQAMRDLRFSLIGRVITYRMSFFDRYPSGRLVSRTVNDVEGLAELFTTGLIALIGDTFMILAIVVAAFIVSWEMALAIFPALILMIIATNIFRKHARRSFQKIQGILAQINGYLAESLQGIRVIQMFGSEGRSRDRFRKINKDYFTEYQHTIRIYSYFFPAVEGITVLSKSILIIMAAIAVGFGLVEVEVAITFLLFSAMFFRPLRQIADQYNTLQAALASGERLEGIINLKDAVPADGEATVAGRINTLSLEDVSFHYDETDPVLKHVNLDIHGDESIAIVGATGSGKSTQVALLQRQYDVVDGRVALNGIDVRDLSLTELRRRVAMVPQDVFLFADTVLENIRLHSPEISETEVIEAAKKVEAHGFISALPEGYHTLLRERGNDLSMGQRQLIAFARAFVFNPDVIILDEATANIDSETERLIQDAIDTFLKDRCAIVIAHRLSTIKKVDRIVVLHRGEIKEVGTHQELLAERGLYYRLYQLQYSSDQDAEVS